MPDSVTCLIVGASARAAAQSALRAGFQPLCIDAYADRDLREVCHCWSWPSSSQQLLELAETLPAQAWMFTGGLENRPGLVDRLSRRVPLWGNDGKALRLARDPVAIHRLLREANLPALLVRSAEAPPPGDGLWLVKPRFGCGGRGISVWRGQTTTLPQEPYYFQQLANGCDISALYLARPTQVEWIGSARQWSGLTSCPSPHAWQGNLVGEPLVDEVVDQMHRIGRELAERLGLRGLFGCDFRLSGTTPWLLEINPRYTGSVELFEWALRRPLLREHSVACGFPPDKLPEKPNAFECHTPTDRCFGKRIVYANQSGLAEFPDDLPRWTGGCTPSPLADLPMFGQPLLPGDPICSILVSGPTPSECDRQIQSWMERILHWIRPT